MCDIVFSLVYFALNHVQLASHNHNNASYNHNHAFHNHNHASHNHVHLASDNHNHASQTHVHLASHYKLIHWLAAGAPVVPQSHFLVKMPTDDHLPFR